MTQCVEMTDNSFVIIRQREVHIITVITVINLAFLITFVKIDVMCRILYHFKNNLYKSLFFSENIDTNFVHDISKLQVT